MNHAHVIGAGPAGHAAACQLARSGWQVDLYSAEAHHPYNRIEVTKSLLAGTAAVDDHRLSEVPANVTLHLGDNVEVVGDQLVSQRTGKNLLTSPVILAIGASPIGLPQFPDAMQLRTAQDAINVRKVLLEQSQLVNIIGAGVLGMEAASSLVDDGHRVHVHDLETDIMPRMLPSQAAKWLRQLHERRGIVFSLGTPAAIAESSCTIVSVGIRPETVLAQELGLLLDDGIVVDELGRTSRPRIYAAGDCTALRVDGCSRRDEDLASARASATRSATGVLVDAGAQEPPQRNANRLIRRWSQQAGLRITSVRTSDARLGVESGQGSSEAPSRGSVAEVVVNSDDDTFESVCVHNGQVVSATAIAARPNPRGAISLVGKTWIE